MLEAWLEYVADFRLKIILARKSIRMIHLTRSAQLDDRLSHSIRFNQQSYAIFFRLFFCWNYRYLHFVFKWLHTFVGFGGGDERVGICDDSSWEMRRRKKNNKIEFANDVMLATWISITRLSSCDTWRERRHQNVTVVDQQNSLEFFFLFSFKNQHFLIQHFVDSGLGKWRFYYYYMNTSGLLLPAC